MRVFYFWLLHLEHVCCLFLKALAGVVVARARRRGLGGRTVKPWRGTKLVDEGRRRAIRAAASQQRGRDSEARRRLAPRKWARPPARPGDWPQLGGGWALARSLLRALRYSY